MTPFIRKFALTAHISSSVGWFGAVVGFLVLAVAGLNSQNVQFVRGFYLAMELTGWYVIVPFCLASLATGLIVSPGSKWGLFRHYWVSSKFFLTIVSTLILFGFTQPLADVLGKNAPSGVKWSYEKMPEEKHSTIYHPAALKAFRTLFKPVKLDE